MSVKHSSCVTVICDECGDPYQGYEGEFTVHFDSADDFLKEQEDYDEETRWHVEGDKHFCSTCVCKRETNHALTENVGGSRYCRCGSKWDRAVIGGR